MPWIAKSHGCLEARPVSLERVDCSPGRVEDIEGNHNVKNYGAEVVQLWCSGMTGHCIWLRIPSGRHPPSWSGATADAEGMVHVCFT